MSDLSVRNLTAAYRTKSGGVRAVDRVSFDIEEGEIFGIVGESGCGKSTLANTILRLYDDNCDIVDGVIDYDGRDIAALGERELARTVRGKEISMVFQDPHASLDPVYTIGRQLIETIRRHLDVTKSEARERAIDVLSDVGIPSPEERLDDYPHAFSGGQRQRIVIAIALSCDPGLLIADEPTTGLDVSVQAQILDLLAELNETKDTSIMLITHDLGVVAETCDRVGVMYAGNIVEIGDVESIFDAPGHPYTQALLRAIPERHSRGQELSDIPGFPPDLRNPPAGCRYNPRCGQVCSDACESGDIPPTYDVGGSTVRCYLHDADENPAFDGPTTVLAEPGEER